MTSSNKVGTLPRNLRAYHGMSSEMLVLQLRDAEIAGAARPNIIAAFDDLLESLYADPLDSPEVQYRLDDERQYGRCDMLADILQALKDELGTVGLSKIQEKQVVAIVRKVAP